MIQEGTLEKLRKIAVELGISKPTIDRRLADFRIAPDDIVVVRAQRRWFAQHADRILSSFQSQMDIFRKSHALAENSHGEDRLADLVRRYLDELFACDFSPAAIDRRLRVGIVHDELKIEQHWYLAAYSWLLTEITETARSSPVSLVGDPDSFVAAFTKIVLFDVGVVLEAYNHANHHSLETLAKTDVLTGLPNLNFLVEELSNRLIYAPSSSVVHLFCIGLNRFKAVNETLGHGTGDEILKKVAGRLLALLPPTGILSRLGGDIFIIGVIDCETNDWAEDFATQISEALGNRPVDLDGFSVDVSATVGAAAANSDGTEIQRLLGSAEIAMYHAKSRQLTNTVFDAGMKRFSVAQLGIGAEIQRAMEKNELVLFYQPKLNTHTEQVVGVEALIRWVHPIKGFMSPGLFLPVVEETVLIHPVADWVLDTAIREAASWQALGLDLMVSVNLSAANLQNVELPNRIGNLLKRIELPPSRLMLEITESGLMADPRRAKDTVVSLKNLGVKLSIDDFGTGYSSLAYLKTLPVDEVKIDQVFVFAMRDDIKDARIVKATVGLAHNLGLEVTAEGVENQETLQMLKQYGCDTVQGFYFSKPLPEDELEVWLKQKNTQFLAQAISQESPAETRADGPPRGNCN
jgi:diguanylate cyclase (GGDEF)-like protein